MRTPAEAARPGALWATVLCCTLSPGEEAKRLRVMIHGFDDVMSCPAKRDGGEVGVGRVRRWRASEEVQDCSLPPCQSGFPGEMIRVAAEGS